jgi:hypothetical protein
MKGRKKEYIDKKSRKRIKGGDEKQETENYISGCTQLISTETVGLSSNAHTNSQ